MVDSKNENLEDKFHHLFEVINTESFIKKKTIGGEVPFFISTYHPKNQVKEDRYIASLIKKLDTNGIRVLEVNLYDLSIKIIKERGKFDRVLEKEKSMNKDKFLKLLQSMLDVETKIMPVFQELLSESKNDILFITGVGLVYPYIRSHNILNNLQKISKTVPTLMFFPGEYDGTYLNLFGKLKDDNYYRAFNIDIIKLKKEQ